MPISRREFESAEPDPTLLVTEFLHSNPDYAYILPELIEELTSRGIILTEKEVQNILASLQNKGRIESKIRYGVIYYIYSKRIGFRPS